jgi:hypothetical protein
VLQAFVQNTFANHSGRTCNDGTDGCLLYHVCIIVKLMACNLPPSKLIGGGNVMNVWSV